MSPAVPGCPRGQPAPQYHASTSHWARIGSDVAQTDCPAAALCPAGFGGLVPLRREPSDPNPGLGPYDERVTTSGAND